ncbi:hypothetical protein DM01DRAFT_1340489 [Hesseltinella vesiculosa]|uniref:Uncharacterized protein n=1 Tax=Hesseltinella vesiculosa TaxID=101127 RepID=A0A1X2G3S5_9FUNG|nr:hypothetical protein DM01DRAFT_1340489 [Hesseltinella vesiculosa]
MQENLEQQILMLNNSIKELNIELLLWQDKRQMEATLTRMTPEERTAVVSRGEAYHPEMTTDDLDSIL